MEWSGPGKDTGPGYLRKNILQNKLGYMFGDKLRNMHEYTDTNMKGPDIKHGDYVHKGVLGPNEVGHNTW